MKKLVLSCATMIAALTGVFAQVNVQHAVLNTTIPTMIALRPYDASLPADNQSLSATVTTAGVFSGNAFQYTGGGPDNELAYRIYSNVTYKVSLEAQPTAGSNDQLNNYILFHARTLPSPQNALAPWPSNGNADHSITQGSDLQLAYATGTSKELLRNTGYNTGKYIPPSAAFLPLDPINTDFAAFAIKFKCSPGFSVFPGVFTTNLTVTATTP